MPCAFATRRPGFALNYTKETDGASRQSRRAALGGRRERSLTETTMGDYLRRSRSAWYSFLFVLPLLALYHVGVVVTNLGQGGMVVNGADALLQAALRGVGVGGWFASGWFLAAIAGVWIYRADPSARREPVRKRSFA